MSSDIDTKPTTDAAAMVEPAMHRIIESFLDNRAQTIRCACGKTAQFGRGRTYLGTLTERGRALAEFVCTGSVITLRSDIIREVE